MNADGTNRKGGSDNDELFFIDSDGSNKQNINISTDMNDIALSPDESNIIFSQTIYYNRDHDNLDYEANLYRIKIDGSDLTQVTSRNSLSETDPDWGPRKRN